MLHFELYLAGCSGMKLVTAILIKTGVLECIQTLSFQFHQMETL